MRELEGVRKYAADEGWKIRHADIIRGGELVFEMTNNGERK